MDKTKVISDKKKRFRVLVLIPSFEKASSEADLQEVIDAFRRQSMEVTFLWPRERLSKDALFIFDAFIINGRDGKLSEQDLETIHDVVRRSSGNLLTVFVNTTPIEDLPAPYVSTIIPNSAYNSISVANRVYEILLHFKQRSAEEVVENTRSRQEFEERFSGYYKWGGSLYLAVFLTVALVSFMSSVFTLFYYGDSLLASLASFLRDTSATSLTNNFTALSIAKGIGILTVAFGIARILFVIGDRFFRLYERYFDRRHAARIADLYIEFYGKPEKEDFFDVFQNQTNQSPVSRAEPQGDDEREDVLSRLATALVEHGKKTSNKQ